VCGGFARAARRADERPALCVARVCVRVLCCAVRAQVFVHPLPFNVIPHIDSFVENGYTKEEMKVTAGGDAVTR
jgi:aspartate-semialdehyde dehydrogenase